MKTKHAAVPFGTPQNYEHIDDLAMVRTGTSAIGDLNLLREKNPGQHISLTVQLAEFYRRDKNDANKRHTSLRQRYALLAHESYTDLVVQEEDVPADIRSEFWGLAALRLDQPTRLDAYLEAVGRMIAERATQDLAIIDSIHLDTAAWSMPRKRGALGCNLSGADLERWITDRCAAFARGLVPRVAGSIPITLNGIGPGASYHLRFDDIAAGYGMENWGTRWYLNNRYPRLRDAIIAQWDAAATFLLDPPTPCVGLIFNPIPDDWSDRIETLGYLRLHGLLFDGLRAIAQVRNVPIYWQCERTERDQALWVPDDYQMVNDQILEEDWKRIRTPMNKDALVICEAPTHRVTVAIDDANKAKIIRTYL